MVSFRSIYCWIQNKKRKLIGTGAPTGKLYKLNCDIVSSSVDRAFVAGEKESSNKINLWRQRLAHVISRQLHQLVEKGVDLQSEDKMTFCEACVHGNMHRLAHPPLKDIKSTEKLQLVHTDVCGPMQTQSFGGNVYFITFTDDYSRYCKTYFLKKKSDALQNLRNLKLLQRMRRA